MREYYTCKRYRLLSFLMARGFKPFQTLPDPENPRFSVWRFKSTPALEAAVAEYFRGKKGGSGKC